MMYDSEEDFNRHQTAHPLRSCPDVIWNISLFSAGRANVLYQIV